MTPSAAASAIGQRESGAEGDERPGEGTSQPGQHPRTRDDLVAHGGGNDAVASEDEEREQHEHGTQPEHV